MTRKSKKYNPVSSPYYKKTKDLWKEAEKVAKRHEKLVYKPIKVKKGYG